MSKNVPITPASTYTKAAADAVRFIMGCYFTYSIFHLNFFFFLTAPFLLLVDQSSGASPEVRRSKAIILVKS